jgi:hypothetical protein
MAVRSKTRYVFDVRIQGPWVRIPLEIWMFFFSFCVVLCRWAALRPTDHPSKESYHLSVTFNIFKYILKWKQDKQSNRVIAIRSQIHLVIFGPHMQDTLIWFWKVRTRVEYSISQIYDFVSILTHGAEPFLWSRHSCSYSKTSQHFTEPEGSLSYS